LPPNEWDGHEGPQLAQGTEEDPRLADCASPWSRLRDQHEEPAHQGSPGLSSAGTSEAPHPEGDGASCCALPQPRGRNAIGSARYGSQAARSSSLMRRGRSVAASMSTMVVAARV